MLNQTKKATRQAGSLQHIQLDIPWGVENFSL